jgi:hypothetical protein
MQAGRLAQNKHMHKKSCSCSGQSKSQRAIAITFFGLFIRDAQEAPVEDTRCCTLVGNINNTHKHTTGQGVNKAVGFGQRPRPLHYRYIRTDTCVRWGVSVKYIAVKSLPFHFQNGLVTAVSEVKTVTWIQKWF